MKPKSKEEIQENLASVGTFLSMHSALLPGEDAISWAAECIRSYVEGKEKSLDHPLVFVAPKEKIRRHLHHQANMMIG